MADLCLRNATADDAAAIVAIWNPVIRDTLLTVRADEMTEQDIVDLIARNQGDGHAFLVATTQDGAIAGFATYTHFRDGPGYAHTKEHSIYICPDHQGDGTGELMLNAIEDHVRAHGGRVLVGSITGDNQPSQDFHDRNGYGKWATLPGIGCKFGEYHDITLWGKDLTQA
ncbi:GNAT family N-acetyltransferase [Paracoccus sp. (in: a-proteobacteria)]|uniref:GNAT family N-acetyltransferase n=1 Tax=Paracoccus sp. TaxID=267 RepID=UPI0026E0ABF6|nr:GNAT family N-acetyltransferase [Paracoccus sp. (in: a-proteobacteria)]MDO5648500.1 GNAT family N-acetyltransferase [Paracoccus sp. (in: a-proteobacteria)]